MNMTGKHLYIFSYDKALYGPSTSRSLLIEECRIKTIVYYIQSFGEIFEMIG